MEPNPPRTPFFRRRNRNLKTSSEAKSKMESNAPSVSQIEPLWIVFLLAMFGIAVGSANAVEFIPDQPESEFLPAAEGEPSVDFCATWNPEFGYRGYRCCSNGAVSRSLAGKTWRSRRARKNSCAPNRKKWTFCDEMTPAQKEYIAKVKAGTIDALETIQKNFGSRGGQAFCSAGNGFLVEGRPLVPTERNRIELRNEARCANFGTDPAVGALEWMGREIKKEFFEPEFQQARLIIGDISAPRGGCIAGRAGRRAHKSHTAGIDVDLAYFNPRSGHDPEERFTRTFYVASNWWFLKKVFKNPMACVKVIFVDRKHIASLARYAKDDSDWEKLKPFIRHVRGHRDHFHIRFGSGPGAPGCAVDPNIEEDEDISDAPDEGLLVKNEESAGDEAEASNDSEKGDAERSERKMASTDLIEESELASAPHMAQTTLPPHKLEPSITAQYTPKRKKRRSSKRSRTAKRSTSKKTRVGKK